MRSFIKSLLAFKQKLVLMMIALVIVTSRLVHTKKYAQLYIWIYDVSGKQAIQHGSWEWYNIDNLRYLVESKQITSSTFLDIGSNVGFYSCNLANYFHSILAFEPNPIAYHVLKANMLLAEKLSATYLNCFNYALGSNAAPINLDLFASANTASLSLKFSSETSPTNRIYSVPVFNASSAISDNVSDINSVSAIKINVEGYESNVLNGLKEFFTTVNILPLLTIEMLDNVSNPDITSLLIGFGYKYFYSYRRSKLNTLLGLRPVMYELLLDELNNGRFQLVYCSSYPLAFK